MNVLVCSFTRPVLALLITAFAGVITFVGPVRADDAPRPGAAKVIEFLKKQQQQQLEQQRQMRRLIEEMQKQAAPLPDVLDPFPPVAIPLLAPGENSDIAIDQPGLKVRSVTRSSGSSYSLQNGKLIALIAEANVKATLQGKMTGGKMTLDRIELDEPAGRRVYNSLDQVPAAAREVIGRQIAQWAKEARGF